MEQYCNECGLYHESKTGSCTTNNFIHNNFIQVIPDSQFFTALEQILAYAHGVEGEVGK